MLKFKIKAYSSIFIVITVLGVISFSSCKSSGELTKKEQKQAQIGVPVIEKLQVNRKLELEENEMNFKITDVKIEGEIVRISVEYGGGCVKPHDFDLVSTVTIKEDGITDVYLLHKTKDDMCKMLIMEDLYFDISKITKLRSKKLKGFRLNENQIFLTVKK